ncbi:CPA1 family monovalent cation:H+ antiporter [Sphingomonas aerophila]|uniref:CPA1 family monovalent cation:H+ antiporter n=2 Tax=Sphingomonas aerophila TaxID=1344948 RepID=A0A7W9B9X6_9SPHN|nr:CPA1 family monovalent cation:H+ antiporter [Sphingomonas aerophila]
MTMFESLLLLLLAAIVLLQVARRVGLPYPAMLALAGVAFAFVPGAPTLRIEPETVLALFIAPVLLDAAYDFPLGAASRLWRPLAIMVLGAVLVTTAVVATIGWAFAGLPIAAAIVLGAIVAPPDAAAATAVAGTVTLPRRTVAVLKGESLLNDATALLLFSGALAIQTADGSAGQVALRLVLAVPGGLLLGVASGWVVKRVSRYVAGTLGGNLFQFVAAFGIWLIAEHLELSAVLAVVASAVVIARGQDGVESPRMRVHSFAVWATVVFLLNVLAFMLMGMQARAILGRLDGRAWDDLELVGLVIAGVVASRFAVVMAWNYASRHWRRVRGSLDAPTIGQGVVVSWAGMRGLLSLATAFALPANFPQRDLVVLTAFGVVLATLVFQGMTLAPLVRLFKLDRMEDPQAELAEARRRLTDAALSKLDDLPDGDGLRATYQAKRAAHDDPERAAWLDRQRQAGLAVVAAQREALDDLREDGQIGSETFFQLQEELDWRALTLLPDEERRIEEA